MADATVEPLINAREEEWFLRCQRDVEGALVHARPYSDEEIFKSRQTAIGAADVLKALKNAVKDTEEERKKAARPYRETDAAMKRETDEMLSQANAAIEVLTERGNDFLQREEEEAKRQRREEQERLDRVAKEKAAAAQEAADAAEAAPQNPAALRAAAEARQEWAQASVATPTEKAQPNKLRGDASTFGGYTNYDFEVVDFAALADEHKQPNKQSLRAAINAEKAVAKAQKRDFNLQLIPGVVIVPKRVGVSR